ncbi:MAG: FtsX-like permease family protein [Chloroflexi bacterium]|nr:FtsX-like permease family protein [Chloroflexota bacterium]
MSFQLSLAARYLWGRKLRSFLTTLAIVIGVMTIFGMGTVLPSMMKSFQQGILALSGQVDVTITHKTGEAFSAGVLDKVKNVEGVRVVAGSISRPMNLPPNFFGRGVSVAALTLVGVDPAAGPLLRDYTTTEGRFLKQGDGNVAVIRTNLADQLGLKLGDTLRIPTTEGVVKLQIVGLLPGRPLAGGDEVLITLAQAQKLLDMTGRVNIVEANLNTTDVKQRQAITDQIQAQLGKTYNLNALTSGSEIFASLGTAQAVFNGLGLLTLFMGAFIIFNTFRTIVAERRHDIGMLRAIGASRGAIIGLIMSEGLVQGIAGTAIGLVLGYALGAIIMRGAATMAQQFLSLKLGLPVVQPGLVIASVVLGVGVTLLAGLIPALTASRVAPLEVLRPMVGDKAQRIGRGLTIAGAIMIVAALVGLISGNFAAVALGGLLLLLGLVFVGPALVKPIARVLSGLVALAIAREGTGELARGNITRQTTRSAITASATMIGLAIVVGAGGLMWSLNGSLMGVFQKTMGSDYMLVPPSVSIWEGDVGATTILADKIRSVPGVGTVTTWRYAQSEIPTSSARGTGAVEISMLGIDPPTFREISGMDFTEGNPDQAYAALTAGRAIIVNGILAVQAGLKAGDTVTLATPQGQTDYRVAAVGGDVLNMKINTAYISQANMRQDFNKAEDIFVQVNMAQGADPAAVEARLKTIVEDYPQFRFVATREYLAEFGKQFDAMFAGVYVLLGLLSIPSLIAILNTLAIGVIERTREIGMLRAIGAARRQVRRMVVAEALLLAAIGTAFGLLSGLYLSYLMVAGMSASGVFRMAYSFPLASILAASAAGLIFGVLAALFPARQAAQMEIIKALRYE